MTEDEKVFLMGLLNKHELSLYKIINLLGIGSIRSAMCAVTIGDEALEHAMIDLTVDCMSFLMKCREDISE